MPLKNGAEASTSAQADGVRDTSKDPNSSKRIRLTAFQVSYPYICTLRQETFKFTGSNCSF